jgi:hypothetical protein
MDDLIRTIKDIAAAHPDHHCDLHFGPVSDQEVDTVERELGVRLPRSFRAYLKGFAGGLMFGYEICGIPTPKSRIPSASEDSRFADGNDNAIVSIVAANRRRRKSYPPAQIYFCCDGGDFSFFLETARTSPDGECPVLMYGPGASGVQVADTFIDFLKSAAAGRSFRP